MSFFPMRRIYEVHCSSPFPIEMALWAHVGSKRNAMSAERRIHSQLSDYRERGEWFRMSLGSPEHKAKFHAVCKVAVARATGRQLKWRKVSMDDVRSTLGVDKALAVNPHFCYGR
jgi:hypothetical protein